MTEGEDMRYAIAHIADIHYRKKEPEGATTLVNAFIDNLSKQKNLLTDYQLYLAITGDIVFEGDDSESYSSFLYEFNEKLNKIGITKSFRLIVPGNHDINRSVIKQNFIDYQNQINENIHNEQKFNNHICNRENDSFANYLIFDSEFACFGMDFSLAGKGWVLNDELGVYCLNTALCSFGGINNINDEKSLAIFTRGLIDWCNKNKKTTNIILMHHPISHLKKWCEDELKRIIEDNFILCLCGHSHEQNIFYNKISQKSLICSAPQLFTTKEDLLGYGLILIENNLINKIIYKEYVKGKFLNGLRFTENNEGIVLLQNSYFKHIDILECKLKNALAFFKNQPELFVKPKLSKEREFNTDTNLLDHIIKEPKSSLIVAHPQFGLTCLSHYMRLEAFKSNKFWIYVDAKYSKARKVNNEIDEQLQNFNKTHGDIKCIIIDSWDSTIIDHRNLIQCIDKDFRNIPIIIMLNYSEIYFNSNFEFSKLNTKFDTLHLQALQRHKVRELVSKYNQKISIANEDIVVKKVVKDLEALNIHRTPINCLTLLKVLEKDFNEVLVNRTKMIKTVLLILFTDSDSFTYSSTKPDLDECEYILGRFCKSLVEKRVRKFKYTELMADINKFCDEELMTIDIGSVINILESNNILIRSNNDELEFKHSYWIYYFAATYMLHDERFKEYILNEKNYVNFPEIIEYYTGIDGRRDYAIKILLNDLNNLIETVETKIGISNDFNPLEGIVWNPSKESIETIRKEISEKVERSNLPINIKDQHADQFYNSEAPYNQTIHTFLNEYSVISLMQGIKASSRALRNSNFVKSNLKKNMLKAILNGWNQISKVILWLSPTLAHEGKAVYEGLGLTLIDGHFEGTFSEKLKKIYIANPYNVVTYLKDDLSSKKLGSLLFENLYSNPSEIQKHLLSLFIIKERPIGWSKIFDFMNLLHRNSFILSCLYDAIDNEIKKGFASKSEITELKKLASIVVAKHNNAPKRKTVEIPKGMTINAKNELKIDMIFAAKKKNKLIR